MKKLVLAVSILVSGLVFSQDTIKIDGSNLEQIENIVIDLVNEYRASKGIHKLVRKEIIDTFAMQHCNNMKQDFFKTNDIWKSVAHDFPGLTFRQRQIQFQNKYTEATGIDISGENCQGSYLETTRQTYNIYTAQEIVQIWKNCPAHNWNMLHKTHKYVGIDILIIDDKTIVVSIDFGTDLADLFTIEVR